MATPLIVSPYKSYGKMLQRAVKPFHRSIHPWIFLWIWEEVRKMAYFELLARCRWLSHTISMAEGFSRATQSMPIAGSFCGYIDRCCTSIEILWENVATSSATTKNSDQWIDRSMDRTTHLCSHSSCHIPAGYTAHCCTIEILWENVATSSVTSG